MDEISFMISSFLSLFLITGFAAATPDSFERTTGINTDNLQNISFGSIGLSEDQVVGSPADCSDITFARLVNVNRVNGTVSKEANASVGWFTLDASNAENYIIDANSPEWYYVGDWIKASLLDSDGDRILVDSDYFFEIEGGGNVIDLSSYESEQFEVSRVNVSIYADDARVTDVSNSCIVSKTSEGAGGSGLVPAITNAVSGAVSGFVSFLGSFFGILGGIISAFFKLLTASGNQVSVTILRLYVGGNILGWLYIFGNFIKDVIPFT